MSSRATTVLWALCALLLSGCKSEHGPPAPTPSASAPAPPSAAPILSSTAAHALIVDNCLSCHAEEMIAQQRLTPAGDRKQAEPGLPLMIWRRWSDCGLSTPG